eukprot:CAMPEP_0114160530 /NCGR_PEP_ID=MMETSP0043_2-20121206/28405_1 /TAXON_ID=464988 /ORGANISM="Hemiselmis andersenii, Strain CCMP644" /LENGTH=49 /DNA_ID= /DNA_START= /DNA_END= /DNA_ORIENTATION=
MKRSAPAWMMATWCSCVGALRYSTEQAVQALLPTTERPNSVTTRRLAFE